MPDETTWTQADADETWEFKEPPALPEDWYPAQLLTISKPMPGQFGPNREWQWRIPTNLEPTGWFALKIRTPDNVGPETNAGQWTAALLGVDPHTKPKVKLGDLFGRWCHVYLVKNKKGYNKINEVRAGGPPPEVAAAIAPSMTPPSAQPAAAPVGVSPEMLAAVAAMLAQQQEQAAAAAAEAAGRVAEPASEATVMDAPHPAGAA